jgi:hypothetical protein
MIRTSLRKPVFRVKEEEGILVKIVVVSIVCGSISGMIYFLIMLYFTGWDNLVMFFICLMFFFTSRRGPKEFILYDDQLIVRQSLYSLKAVDDTFIISDIKELIFTTIRGKFGGPHIIIMCRKRMHETYRVSFRSDEIMGLKHAFKGAGILVKEKGL